jgi:peptide subunit release factor 1 (eRF1)
MTTIAIDPQKAGPRWEPPSRETLERLALVRAPRHLVVTCYLRLGVEDRIRRRYLLTLKEEVQSIQATLERLELADPDRDGLRRDLARIVDHVSSAARLPHAPGAAFIACESLGVFEAVPLPRVHRTRIMIDETPRLAEMVSSVEAAGRILIAVVDRAGARLFDASPFELHELPCLISPSRRGGKFGADRKDAPGWGERDYHNRLREERHRLAEAVVRQLTELAGQLPIQGILLAGPEKSTAELERFLPRGLRARFLGRSKVNPTAVTPAQIHQVAFEAWQEAERRAEGQLVEELVAGFGTGWAVDGPRPTLRALARGQLRTLVVRAGQCGSGFRCSGSGRLVLSRIECREEGDPIPIADLVNEAIEEALRQRLELVVIDDPAAGEAITGLAGYLRFR